MASAGLAALLGKPNQTVRAILKKYDMYDGEVPIICQNIYKGGDTMNMVISACGEGSYAMCRFTRPENQCLAVSNCLWENLIDVVNQKQDVYDIFRMLEYVEKLLQVKMVSILVAFAWAHEVHFLNSQSDGNI